MVKNLPGDANTAYRPRHGKAAVSACPPRVRCRDDGGATFIEFALLLPFVAVMVFGTVDLGRAFMLRTRLTNMAREGAFYGSTHPTDIVGCSPNSITSVAQGEDPAVTGSTVTVTNGITGVAIANNCGGASPQTNLRLRVRVSAPMTILTPMVGAIVGNTVTVGSKMEVVAT